MITLSNPRIKAEFTDWPLGGGKRGNCVFEVEHNPKKGYRVSRQTFGKPKCNTYGGKAVIVDGSNGKTYILQRSLMWENITISRSDFMNATGTELGIDGNSAASVSKGNPAYDELLAIINSVYEKVD